MIVNTCDHYFRSNWTIMNWTFWKWIFVQIVVCWLWEKCIGRSSEWNRWSSRNSVAWMSNAKFRSHMISVHVPTHNRKKIRFHSLRRKHAWTWRIFGKMFQLLICLFSSIVLIGNCGDVVTWHYCFNSNNLTIMQRYVSVKNLWIFLFARYRLKWARMDGRLWNCCFGLRWIFRRRSRSLSAIDFWWVCRMRVHWFWEEFRNFHFDLCITWKTQPQNIIT